MPLFKMFGSSNAKKVQKDKQNLLPAVTGLSEPSLPTKEQKTPPAKELLTELAFDGPSVTSADTLAIHPDDSSGLVSPSKELKSPPFPSRQIPERTLGDEPEPDVMVDPWQDEPSANPFDNPAFANAAEPAPQNPFEESQERTLPPPVALPTAMPPKPQETVNTAPLEQIPGTMFLNKSDFEDPVTYQIMADPVTCQDGHTYDRAVIERCFDDRIKAEEERQRRERENNNEDNDDGTTCCGRAQRPIELLSPISNKVVSGVLVPNFILDQQIVRLMEANAFRLSQAEIQDWQERRQEKKIRDKKRQEEEENERAREQERRQNALLAEQRRREEEEENGNNPVQESAASAPVDPSQLVRFDPNHCGQDETGLAVPLAEDGTQIPPGFVTGSGRQLRCMVDRCAKRLEGDDGPELLWCARCARLVCSDCMAFDVAQLQGGSIVAGSQQKICVDCITQLVDAMESAEDIHLRQRRVLLLRKLDPHMARCANRAAMLQQRAVRHEANNRHTPKLIEMEQEISTLQKHLANLQNQAALAAARAAAAQSDETVEKESEEEDMEELERKIAELTEKCEKLEREQTKLADDPPPNEDDEDALVEYFEALSRISHDLETARVELATSLSRVSAKAPSDESNPEILALEAECQRLQDRYEEVSNGLRGADEYSVEMAVELSTLTGDLEEAQFRLVTARSVAASAKQMKEEERRTRADPLPRTTHFAVSAQARSASPRRKSFLSIFGSGRKKKPSSEVREFLASVFELRDNIEESPIGSSRTEKVNELLSLLDQAPEFFPDGASEELGLRAARDELMQLSTKKKQERGRQVSEIDDDIFSDAVADLLPSFNDMKPAADPEVQAIEQIFVDLAAIGDQFDEWPLPLNLHYPTPRMVRQLEVLRNTLELRKVESERAVEGEWMERFRLLESQQESLENGVSQARREVADAQANAQDEERRQRERAEQRRQREQERLERERQLREQAERAERERQELARRHEQEELETRRAFSRAAGESNNGAEAFGGVGDLRMCKRCKAGPIENQACSDLRSHNDTSRSYKGNTVGSRRNPNHCPHCGWFDADWAKWPYWDGIVGPH